MHKPKFKHLCEAERAIIPIRHQEQVSLRAIAREIGHNSATVSRELKRNISKRGYQATSARQKAAKRKKEKTPSEKGHHREQPQPHRAAA